MSLKERIIALIQAQGPMSVGQFMSVALLDPKQGYYATRDPIGQTRSHGGGDFITAPEISQMFGEMIGLWLIQSWKDQGSPKSRRLVELGPGHGTLMADILRACAVLPPFLQGLEVVLVEASPVLRERQRASLQHFEIRISWQSQFGQDLCDRALFLLANEFFDALPIRQYVKTKRGWCERMIVTENGELAFALAPVALPIAAVPAEKQTAPLGAVYEISPARLALCEEIASTIAAKGGAGLIIDYGYAKALEHGETLQAVAAHHFDDVLAEPGSRDISAHVDFAALLRAARKAGAQAYGPATQGDFLRALGIEERTQHLIRANPEMAQKLRADCQRLIDSAQMGELFKVMAITPSHAQQPLGFAHATH